MNVRMCCGIVVTVQLFIMFTFLVGIGDFEPETSIEPTTTGEDLIYVAKVGGSLRLLCLVPDGVPQPKWYWTRPGHHVVSDNGRIRVNENSELQLDGVTLDDAGNYTCHAENLAGTRSVTVSVVVTSEYIHRLIYIYNIYLCI